MANLEPKSTKINPSLVKKTSARLLAVQTIYQRVYLETPPDDEVLISRMLSMVEDEKDTDNGESPDPEFALPASPNPKLYRMIVAGYLGQQETIEQRILETLGEARWSGNRLSRLLKAILRSAAFELIYNQDLSKSIVMNEYVTITASFFDDPELSLMNGLLQEIADSFRGDERTAHTPKTSRKSGKLSIAPKVEYKKREFDAGENDSDSCE